MVDNSPIWGGKALIPSEWTAEVDDIRSFLDEDYSVPLTKSGYSKRSLGGRQAQLPWGRLGVDKWASRVIPTLSNTVDDSNAIFQPAIRAIKQACKDAIAFGNSTIIVTENGEVRVSTPENSLATKTPFSTRFAEDYGDFRAVSNSDGILYVAQAPEYDPYAETGSRTFSIFYHLDGVHPNGASKLTPAVRAGIRSASRNKVRAEIAADFYSYPQRIINGAWPELGDKAGEDASKLLSGAATVQVIPADPVTGEKVQVTQFQNADFSPFIEMQNQLAKEVATGLGLTFEEIGVVTTTPQSADVIYASKEGVALEITAWEQEITNTIQAFLNYYSATVGVDAPTLTWQEPALPSKGSAADAVIKLVSAFPSLADNPEIWRWAGLPQNVLDKIQNGSTTDTTPTLPQEGGE